MDVKVGIENSSECTRFNSSPENLSEAEFKDPPKVVEDKLFRLWRDLTPAQASQETFWGYATLEHIRKGKIESDYLAGNGGNSLSGKERIDMVLRGDDKEAVDKAVRSVLRRLSGLPEARGSKSVYVNCPFARAWWRGYVAEEVCHFTRSGNKAEIIKILTCSQEFWEQFIVLVVSRNSVIGDGIVRAALICALSESHIFDDKGKPLLTGEDLKQIIERIGFQTAWQELAVFGIGQLKKIVKKYVRERVKTPS